MEGRKKGHLFTSTVYDIVILRRLRRAENDRLIGLGAFLHFGLGARKTFLPLIQRERMEKRRGWEMIIDDWGSECCGGGGGG